MTKLSSSVLHQRYHLASQSCVCFCHASQCIRQITLKVAQLIESTAIISRRCMMTQSAACEIQNHFAQSETVTQLSATDFYFNNYYFLNCFQCHHVAFQSSLYVSPVASLLH